jgi:pyrroloquinoline quinone (PQQ) biosynthesis protein C
MTADTRLKAKPVISMRADIRVTANDAAIVETDDCLLEFDGPTGRLIGQLADRLDGGSTVEDLATATACDPGFVAALIETLRKHEIVLDLAEAEGKCAGDLRQALRRECAFWAKEIQAHPFWRTLLSGTANSEIVFGWGIEQFHYVDAANEYMAAAAANCRLDHDVRMLIGKRFTEESEHGDIFLRGLSRCGYASEAIVNAPPLPATNALKDYLFELACSDTIATEATFNLMQSSGEPLTKEGLARFYGELTRLYPLAAPMFEAFRDHALIDVGSGHARTIFDGLCDVPGLVTPAVGRRAIEAVRGLAEHFMLFFQNIEAYYGAPNAVVPRRPVNISAFA